MSEATNQRWTCGDYHKGDFRDFLMIQWPSTIGTTDPASGCIALERPSLHESWDLGQLYTRERGSVSVWGVWFQMLSFSIWV